MSPANTCSPDCLPAPSDCGRSLAQDRNAPVVSSRPSKEMASLGGASLWLNTPPPNSGPAQSRSRRLLDLFLHQLAARSHARVVRQVQEPGAGGDRRPLAGVRVRKEPRQHSPGRQGHAGDTGGDRQRARGLAGVRQSVLAGALPRGCPGSHPPPSLSEGGYERTERIIQQPGRGRIRRRRRNWWRRTARKSPPTGST